MITRREFTHSLAVGVLAPLFTGRQRAVSLRVGLLLPASEPAADIRAGVRLALAENERAAALFGQRIHLEEKFLGGGDTMQDANRLIRDGGLGVLIGGTSTSDARQLADAADQARILFLNVGASDNSLRRDGCRPTTYHVAASDAMIASAKAALDSTQANATIELWDRSLERYGASQLNDRFQNRFGRAMTSRSWAGWFALKLAWETGLRAQSAEPSALLTVLGKPETQFDGHKGAPLSFRSWDHQLRQPLYAVVHDHVVAELPDVARNSDRSMRDQLDKFGDPASAVVCAAKQ
jgi:ABC-type branched-subunit amino acid transport system substrate-binding protein